ncbi:UvrD-helicase domain-containing protein [Phenylobacterium sp.]|uniref:UvrD-helicase domain-containing protein n=1 Tax=Phenylobacterium sp. TaxID=1871053 RepID=UPI0035B31BCC
MSKAHIQCVVASAGAGKTTRIVGEIAFEVTDREPEELMATTFTVKAADELIERSRAKLFGDGQAEKASRLLGARFGTVNSICGQIAAEFALDLGRSPQTEVIAETSVGRVFAAAADQAIQAHAPELNDLAEAFGQFDPKRNGKGLDWQSDVQRIIELARANGLSVDDLRSNGERSAEGFLALLPAPADQSSTETVHRELKAAIAAAVANAPAKPSTTVGGTLSAVRLAHAKLQRGERLNWPEWVRLSKAAYAKKDGQAFTDALDQVKAWALRYWEHPQLRAECERFIKGVFACAADALEAYQEFKAERGLVDFTDQETLALEVLDNAQTRARLAERVRRVFVDEFQDSSPLQVAIFTALAEAVEASTWVGDPKQAIYGFRNADSALTQAAFQGVMALRDGPPEVLATSYRSRRGVIDLVNAAFKPAFEAMGLPEEEHAFKAVDRKDDRFDHSPLAVWELEGAQAKRVQALACAIRDTLASAAEWLVEDRKTGAMRPVRPGDIAVLCRRNQDVAAIADALTARGIKVGVEREGLAQTAHVQLIAAALRWTADATDRLALAELARFFGSTEDSDAWLQALGAEAPDAALAEVVPIAAPLAALREQILALTPAELIDAIMGIPEVMALVESWGDCAVRLDDLEALRGFARAYETECTGSGAPATASGLSLALKSANPLRPPSLQPDVVQVLTYHRAKGLEWPLVVLLDLHRSPQPRLFEAVAEADGEIDWRKPLANRWIRYWHWPFGSQPEDRLTQAALASDVGQVATVRAREEETRLLYVGMTRARDYLVFARAANESDKWLRVLDAGLDAEPRMRLGGGTDAPIIVGGVSFPARHSVFEGDDAATAATAATPTFVRLAGSAPAARSPLFRTPSREAAQSEYTVLERIEIGPRIPLAGSPDMLRVGEAVHAILAVDDLSTPLAARLERAQGTLDRWGVTEVEARHVCEASERLAVAIEGRWPGARRLHEAPVHARLGDQLVVGRIDLLIESKAGYAIIDHKSFPGSRDRWADQAVGYGAQLDLYAQAVTAATGAACDELFIHMPLVGALLRVGRKSGSASGEALVA